MVDPAKTYRTRDGREVRIYAVDAGKSDPVHGAVKSIDGDWIHRSWSKEGGYFRDEQNDLDLIEIKHRHIRWINVYPKSGYDSKFNADRSADITRLACIRVEFEEGEGL